MPKQHPKHGEHSNDTDNHSTSLSDRLLNALTQQELAQLIDALFTVLSPELQEEAIANFLKAHSKRSDKFWFRRLSLS